MSRFLPACLAALLLSLWPTAPALAAESGEGLGVAVSPVLPATEMKRRWQPLLDYLGQASGLRLYFQFHESGPAFHASLRDGGPAFAVLGPLQQERARARYRPIVVDTQPLRGLVLVHRDSPVRTVADLQGRVLGLPASLDPAAGPYLRQLLQAQGVQVQFQTVTTQGNAYHSVTRGMLEAMASDSVNYRLQSPELLQQLRVVYTAPPLAPMAFVARRDLPAAEVRAFREALLALRDPALLASLPFAGLRAAEAE